MSGTIKKRFSMTSIAYKTEWLDRTKNMRFHLFISMFFLFHKYAFLRCVTYQGMDINHAATCFFCCYNGELYIEPWS